MNDERAIADFNRAMSRASWKKMLSRLTGADNQLLPYDEVRSRLPVRGQHYIGLKQVPVDRIVGSMGRYNDFDRAFMPIQSRTRQRWINIDRAHYEEINLPPVELNKLGEIYFVKDGNHRVSVARERGQDFIDAYVTEVEIPIRITQDIRLDDLNSKKSQAEFMLSSQLNETHPEAEIELTDSNLYPVVLEHIRTHGWFLSKDQGRVLSQAEAAASWYDHVYLPLVQVVREQGLLKSFHRQTEADLYVWIIEYQKYLQMAYSEEEGGENQARTRACDQLVKDYPEADVSKLIQAVNKANFLEDMMLNQERAFFFEQTQIDQIRPDAQISVTMPGAYHRLLDHIATHRWYISEARKYEVPNNEAVASWYDNVYSPIVNVIREQNGLEAFPNRTETDLYLWIIRHQWYIKETYGTDVTIEDAAESFTGQRLLDKPRSLWSNFLDLLKNSFRSK